ncbi:proline--tRNA ligase [Candidatus Gottesmanbacteria bacterium]|nr:proline--tRNA ligase [Candidatus Gottesmanbacteria bacterium]
MRYSKLFGKTVREAPKEAQTISHKLLYQAGYIRESSSGRYYLLPLGMLVMSKIIDIVRTEMDKAGAQEMLTPVLHPIELWKETNRTRSTGFELTTVKDRRGAKFALGGTAEEMIVDVVRKFQETYKDLPFNIYQFSQKFRDELRAKGGLLRLREFMMKDAYSFHATEADFKREYQNMKQTYTKIFKLLGLETVIVESDNGYIGGEYCHEFVVESEEGESKYFTDGHGYFAHEDVVKFTPSEVKKDEVLMPMKDVEGKGIIGVEELAKYLNIPVEKTTKTILFETDTGQVIAAVIRGGYDINETKLKKIVHCHEFKLASPEVVRKLTNAEVGYAGALNLPREVKLFFDWTTANRTNFEMGANKTNFHTINVNFDRDLPIPEKFYDFAIPNKGDIGPNGYQLDIKKGIEVGNIFQLGHHYTSLMKNAHFTDKDGELKKYYMGCYGIGIARTMAAVVEKHHDNKGIIWPKSVTPYDVHLISIGTDESVVKRADEVYQQLERQGLSVLYDDRETARPGEKFSDFELIGIPIRLVVSAKTGDKVEVKKRTESTHSTLEVEQLRHLG